MVGAHDKLHSPLDIADCNFSPGRFLASSMMKLVLIYLLENYDIESSESRPNSIFFGQAILPPTKAVVTFRRKHNI